MRKKRKRKVKPKFNRQKIGVHIRERDSEGWRIPREGTLSRLVYELIKSGATPKQISESLSVNVNKVRVLAHRFRNPEWASKYYG